MTDARRRCADNIVPCPGGGEDHHRQPAVAEAEPRRMDGTHHGRDTDFRGREPVFGVCANDRAPRVEIETRKTKIISSNGIIYNNNYDDDDNKNRNTGSIWRSVIPVRNVCSALERTRLP